MKNAFVEEICLLAQENEDIFLLVADMGHPAFESFKNKNPERFLNVGIAEQNLAGVAAGLALCGKIPVIFGIASFITTRCFDQIRNNIAYQNLNVKIIGVGTGVSYNLLGSTHHSLEDTAVMRTLPNMAIISPCDCVEARKTAKAAVNYGGPVYIRLARNSAKKIYNNRSDFKIGKAVILREGNDAAIIGTGAVLKNALEAAKILKKEGIFTRVINMHTLKPIDDKAVRSAFLETSIVVTVEEQWEGGLGSAVAEVAARLHPHCLPPFKMMTVSGFCRDYGTYDYLLEKCGLGVNAIVNAIKEVLS